MTGTQQVEVHYVNSGVPHVVKEALEGYYLEHGEFSLEEVLQDQETVYQSLQGYTGNYVPRASASTDSNPNHDQSTGERRILEKEEESSHVDNVHSQLAQDEALAKALQELEDQLAGTAVSETTGTGAEIAPSSSSMVNREGNPSDNASLEARQDDMDPDNMTYEELQSLEEAIGTEGRGLSDELISYLPTVKYKTGRLFSRKDKHEECVICCMAYKNRETLITLPCQHQYHSKCVTHWLKLKKACPICNEEVFGS